MSRADTTAAKTVHHILFPFRIHLEAGQGRTAGTLSIVLGSGLSFVGLGAGLTAIILFSYARRRKMPQKHELLIVSLTGVCGLITLAFIGLKD